MSLLQMNHITFTYEGSFDPVFEDCSFRLDTEWRLGLTGRNGRGKTTLLRLLCGELPYRGSIVTDVRKFDYFPFSIPDETRTVLQAMQNLCPDCLQWQFVRELHLLQVQERVLEQPFGNLSKGEQTKVLLAALFLHEGHFLLIDEPTNHLDSAGRKLVGDYLCRKRGFILVSHDRAFLDRCVDHILFLGRKDNIVCAGNFSTFWQNKQYRDQFELAENEKLKKEVSRLSAAAGRAAGWAGQAEKQKSARNSGLRPDRGYAGHKAAKMMKRAKTTEQRRQRVAKEKAELLQNLEKTEELKLSALPAKGLLAEFQNVSVRYGDVPVCGPVRLRVEGGQRIALQGGNGCGKSSLLRLLLGRPVPHEGTLWRAAGLRISHVPQDTSFLVGNLSGFAKGRGIGETQLRTILRKLDFSREQFEKPLESYSGGQKKKVLIAASLCEQAQLYLWDEPLNFVDIYSRMQIEKLLLDFQPTMLFVEHDSAFVSRVATDVAVL